MARPRKEGLDYFPFDVYLDHKWEAIEAMHGHTGFTLCVRLFQECYKSDSGEADFSGVIRQRTLQKRMNFDEILMNNIIDTAVEVGLFDKKRWISDKVITSDGIKRRIDAVSTNRKNARIRAETSSLTNNPKETLKEHRKGKERKVKEKYNTQLCFTSDGFRTAWERWAQHRKEKKSALTPSTIEAQMKKLQEMGELRAIAAIVNSIEKGYTGIYEANSPSHKRPEPQIDAQSFLSRRIIE